MTTFRHCPRLAASVACGLVLAALTACQKTQFEQEHARAVARNPHGLSVVLDTSDWRHEYREGEDIRFVVEYSSPFHQLFKVDAAEGMSAGAASELLYVSDGQRIDLGLGYVCCRSRLIGVGDDPYVAKPQRAIRLKRGDYEVYIRSRRVFTWDGQ